MKIAIGCDHGGYLLKQDILIWLEEHDIDFEDVGCFSTESVDYPIYGEKVARLVASGACEKGIVICTTGIGISIAANKVKGIRCAHCTDSLSAEMTRRHNDANVLALGAGGISKWLFGGRDLRIERAANLKNIEEYIRGIDEMIERKRALVAPRG